VKEKFSPKFLKRERYINRLVIREDLFARSLYTLCKSDQHRNTPHSGEARRKVVGAKLPPLDVYEYLMLKLEGAYMVKTNQL
jgi:hypothetical protein